MYFYINPQLGRRNDRASGRFAQPRVNKKAQCIHWHCKEELHKRCSSCELLGATDDIYLLWVWGWMYCLFVYLHFITCLHVLLLTLRLSLRFVLANHRQLDLTYSARKSLEKVVVYKAASGKEQNSCKPTGLWLELGPSQYWTISVIGGGPSMEDEGNLKVQNTSGRQQK